MTNIKVVSAAIILNGVIYSMPKPNRHADILFATVQQKNGIEYTELAKGEQGFIDSEGYFLTRKQAVKVAKDSGQITEPKYQPNALFSEDLW